ncbi:MAG: hypothetical protein K6G42_09525 [Lachnospiraceae bacterium]|nr:hypothetical protein [Lachnospiraceae bacterium]
MRREIPPEQYKGRYREPVTENDLLIMGSRPETTVGSITLEDGIYKSLWRLSLETGFGMMIDIRKIPLPQEFIDVCERQDIDPYDAPFDGTIYVAHPVSSYHLKKGISVIGYLTKEKVCRIINRDRESYLGS